MKLHHPIARPEFATIASFGTGRLVRKLNGDYRFLGGTTADRTEAKDWIARFMPEAAISFAATPPPNSLATEH